LKTQKQRIILVRQHLLLQKGAQAHTLAQQTGRAVNWSFFIPDAVGPAHLLGLVMLGAPSVGNWLMLHLESGGGVGSNFGLKMELSEQEPRTANHLMVIYFDRKDCFPHNVISRML
jgi:hypothetical protein